MYKFVHISDCHLGAWKSLETQRLEIESFNFALDSAIKEKVDFIIIAGDLFHANLPDLGVVRKAVKKLRDVYNAGIPIYVVYGSHDYSPNENSMIDILNDAGLIIKLKTGVDVDGKIRLEFTQDVKTGAKLVGISGRKLGIEKQYYEMLDREALEEEKGFKIFILHIGLDELKPSFMAEMESIPISFLPKNFDYYAGGHIHRSAKEDFRGFGPVCYPGTTFAGYPRDLEDSSKGTKRGFFIVDFDEKIRNIRFVENKLVDYLYHEYDAGGKHPNQVQEELATQVSKLNVKNKIVVLKIKGELVSGKTSDVNFSEIIQQIYTNQALHVERNRYDFRSKEYQPTVSSGENPMQIEERVFLENMGSATVSINELKGEQGAKKAISLLSILREDQKINERQTDYHERILSSSKALLKLDDIT